MPYKKGLNYSGRYIGNKRLKIDHVTEDFSMGNFGVTTALNGLVAKTSVKCIDIEEVLLVNNMHMSKRLNSLVGWIGLLSPIKWLAAVFNEGLRGDYGSSLQEV